MVGKPALRDTKEKQNDLKQYFYAEKKQIGLYETSPQTEDQIFRRSKVATRTLTKEKRLGKTKT